MKSIDLSTDRHKNLLKNLIPKDLLTKLETEKTRFRVFDPTTTLYLFLQQILRGISCKGVLAGFNLERTSKGIKPISMSTAAFTRAKMRLNEDTIKEIALKSGASLRKKSHEWDWKGKKSYLIDGTVINLEDTDEIKKEYPLTFANGKPQGQPKLRLLGAFDGATGAFLDGEIGGYSGKGQSETTLIRKLLTRLESGSVLILDRFFTSFFLQDIFLKEGFDYVIRGRDKTLRPLMGKSHDKVINLKRPQIRGHQNYSKENSSPSLKVRVIKSTIKRAGYRPSVVYIMTSFLDKKTYSIKDLEELYLSRWNVELDIRHIKTTLNGNLLRSKSPSMARKELWCILIAFNLIRSLNVGTAIYSNKSLPRKFAFKTSLNMYLMAKDLGTKSMTVLMNLLKTETLKSKYRREPRAIKRRSNRYPLLTKSRKESIFEDWGYARRRGHKGLLRGNLA